MVYLKQPLVMKPKESGMENTPQQPTCFNLCNPFGYCWISCLSLITEKSAPSGNK